MAESNVQHIPEFVSRVDVIGRGEAPARFRGMVTLGYSSALKRRTACSSDYAAGMAPSLRFSR